jgi:RhoGAP domain
VLNSEVKLLDLADPTGNTIGEPDMVTNDTLKLFDPHVVAVLLKRWFGQLSPKILDLSSSTVTGPEITDAVSEFGADPTGAFSRVVTDLLMTRNPQLGRLYLWLLDTLCEAISYRAQNLMSAANMSIVVGPQLVSIDNVEPIEGLVISGHVVHLLQLHLVYWLRTRYGIEENMGQGPQGGFAGMAASQMAAKPSSSGPLPTPKSASPSPLPVVEQQPPVASSFVPAQAPSGASPVHRRARGLATIGTRQNSRQEQEAAEEPAWTPVPAPPTSTSTARPPSGANDWLASLSELQQACEVATPVTPVSSAPSDDHDEHGGDGASILELDDDGSFWDATFAELDASSQWAFEE